VLVGAGRMAACKGAGRADYERRTRPIHSSYLAGRVGKGLDSRRRFPSEKDGHGRGTDRTDEGFGYNKGDAGSNRNRCFMEKPLRRAPRRCRSTTEHGLRIKDFRLPLLERAMLTSRKPSLCCLISRESARRGESCRQQRRARQRLYPIV
jgi:hypothetical protein